MHYVLNTLAALIGNVVAPALYFGLIGFGVWLLL